MTVHWAWYPGDGDNDIDKSDEYELEETELELSFAEGDHGVWFEIVAFNDDDDESEPGYSDPVDPVPSAAPSGLRATRSGSAIRLSWDGASGVSRYEVYLGGPKEYDVHGVVEPGTSLGSTTGTTFDVSPVPWDEDDTWLYWNSPVFYVYAVRGTDWSEPATVMGE